ncbi:type III secretion system chaperone [uncultured Shimia sp.]|uniref:type III secretion system chaperone n=1 Tax=uncultured Shimia sp. TaxID=573152 RepID=UPI0026251D3E|nr:type III secretion system chaperone [uncultured Shimia sp.]
MRLIAILFSLLATSALAEDTVSEPPMTYERLGRIVLTLDPEAQPRGDMFELRISGQHVIVVIDRVADRMRVMAPIREADGIEADEMRRMMQANFDSALDARYALANGVLWSTYIHPLSPLERDQFIEGVAQTVNAAQTYGTLYTGGLLQFGAGDSGALQNDLLEELLKRGQDI